MHVKFKDLTSQRFGRLIAQWPAGKKKSGGFGRTSIYWVCLCDCGNLKVVSGKSLTRNLTRSCGCFNKEESAKRGRTLRTHGKSESIEGLLLYSAAERARKARPKIPFNIGVEDIVVPDICPLLGIPLRKERGTGHHQDSPSVDRIIPRLGYTRGNIQVVSVRANQLKSNATLEEMKMLVYNWEKRI